MSILKSKDATLEELFKLDKSVRIYLLNRLQAFLSEKKDQKKQKYNIKPLDNSEVIIKSKYSYFNDTNSTDRSTQPKVRYTRRKSVKNKTAKT